MKSHRTTTTARFLRVYDLAGFASAAALGDAVVDALRASGEPLTLESIGDATRLRALEGGRMRWRVTGASCALGAALTELRCDGRVVKLPNEGARANATYTWCDSHEHAADLQLQATEAHLASLRARRAPAMSIRIAELTLNGLRHTVLR